MEQGSMNYLWAGMIFCGIVFAAFHGTLPEVTEAAIDSAKEAVTLCITMTGVMSFWLGLVAIAESGGMIAGLTRKMKPVLRFLFPRIPADHEANQYLAANMVANIFGLGWAATPAGLMAMQELEKLEEKRRRSEKSDYDYTKKYESSIQSGKAKKRGGIKLHAVPRGTASTEMCTFLIINISSLQLIPVNIIAYRSQYGSVNPTAVVGPVIAATAVSTAAAVIFCKIFAFRSVQKR